MTEIIDIEKNRNAYEHREEQDVGHDQRFETPKEHRKTVNNIPSEQWKRDRNPDIICYYCKNKG